jgi:hypothetical protein
MASRLASLLFPSSPRSLPFNRGLSIGLRTLHLAASSLLLGGHAFNAESQRLFPLLLVTIASGAGLIALELYRSCDWVYQGMGVMVLVKSAMTALAALWWDQRVLLLVGVVVLGSVGSHMPGRFRHYSLLHGRVLDEPAPKRSASSDDR